MHVYVSLVPDVIRETLGLGGILTLQCLVTSKCLYQTNEMVYRHFSVNVLTAIPEDKKNVREENFRWTILRKCHFLKKKCVCFQLR